MHGAQFWYFNCTMTYLTQTSLHVNNQLRKFIESPRLSTQFLIAQETGKYEQSSVLRQI